MTEHAGVGGIAQLHHHAACNNYGIGTRPCIPPFWKNERDRSTARGAMTFDLDCNRDSAAGAVSQRACVFCGSRVVLYPIADALHLVHGPIGCAAYTWDIRGALSSGPELHRLSFSTDLQEIDVIFGGEKKLYAALEELITRHRPEAAFVYSTCIVGIIGDDLKGVCRRATETFGIPVIPVQSEGFKGNKREGYHAACNAMFQLVGHGRHDRNRSVQSQHPGRFQPGRGTLDHPRLLRPHGAPVRRQHHRRRPRERPAPRPWRRPQRGAVLRGHPGPGQDDAGTIRYAVPARFLFRRRGHGRIALFRGPVL